ncbi:MAG TPA: hypothetical protein VF033_06360, partial [Steroidobacteraceae bacterium]
MTHATASTAVDSWLGSGLGQAVLQAESELMSEALDDVFGWELLQLGIWGDPERLLSGCRTRRRAVIADQRADRRGAQGRVDIGARLSQLPIANGSVDAVILPHTLEF